MSDPNAGFAGQAPETMQAETYEGPGPDEAADEEFARKERSGSLLSDAWRELRSSWIFWISAILIVIFLLMAFVPQLFTQTDPNQCQLTRARIPPSAEAWFGYDQNGCDLYSRTIYGAKASIVVGILTTVAIILLGGVVGLLAGFYGGATDSILSRITDIFFALPIVLGGILILSSFPSVEASSFWAEVSKVVLALAIFGWTAAARIMRSSVIQVRNADYVLAARALGAGNGRIMRRHILPNSIAPIIVIATISLGVFIGAEATLSYLGLGIQPPIVSWGSMISDAQKYLRAAPHMLLIPSFFLSVAVLSFIMLGDAVRDALDPKMR